MHGYSSVMLILVEAVAVIKFRNLLLWKDIFEIMELEIGTGILKQPVKLNLYKSNIYIKQIR